ncbi:hypothetical protein [Brevibacillus daliensis]|uniref:hypothetical protein n=1 Tax=Brevibacillus daliensis TaxID=2892995 RepID=UPI001E51EB21|nr:hypothetical protein [Brevibacillus daliensis]
MEHDLLDDYLDYSIIVYIVEGTSGSSATEKGILHDYDASGILLKQHHLCFIPFSSIRKIEIKARPTLWQRITGVS